MTEETKQIMIAVVALTCKELSDQELAVLNLVGQLDQDPHNRMFDYEKIEELFTERDGTRMHQETKDALAVIVEQRLLGNSSSKEDV